MDEDLRMEKLILKVSFIGSLLLLIAEIIMAFVSRSQAVIMDCLFDIADIIMLGPFMMLVPLLYQPVTEKRPYGFSQVESLFLIVKYGALIAITVKLVIDNIRLIMSGGHNINAGAVATFEISMAVLGLVMYFILRHMNKKLSSPTTKADLCMWRIDSLSTFGVGIAFIIQIILQGTSFGWISTYLDPLI
ncbi:MAG: cation transporter, partial [Anaerovoracaceae bacterium]